jgi:hypothetical protein
MYLYTPVFKNWVVDRIAVRVGVSKEIVYLVIYPTICGNTMNLLMLFCSLFNRISEQ